MRRLVLTIALAVLSAACGTGSAETTAAPAAPVAPTTEAPATTVATASDSEWCRISVEIAESPAFDNLAFVDPVENQRNLEEFGELLDAAAEVAPAEIADAVGTSRQAFRDLIDALAAHEYDFVAMLDDPDALTVINNSQADAAGDAIAAYNQDVCGIANDNSEGTDTDLTDLIDAGGITAVFVQSLVDEGFTEEEATCIAGGLDLAALATAGLDPDVLAAVMNECLTPDRLAEFGN